MPRFLLLRFDAPMQSWSVCGRHQKINVTADFPTKSGVVGILAACLGIERGEYQKLQQLSDSLSYSTATLSRPSVAEDFQATRSPEKQRIVKKQYLCDASFLVAISHPDIDLLAAAVKNPVFIPYFGRKSYMPSRPLFEAVVEAENEIAALLLNGPKRELQVVSETSFADGVVSCIREPIIDQPCFIATNGEARNVTFRERFIYIYLLRNPSHCGSEPGQ